MIDKMRKRLDGVLFYKRIRLLQGLINGEKPFTGPFSITMDVTRRCNRHCLGCRYHSKQVNFPSVVTSGIMDIPLSRVQDLCVEVKSLNIHDTVLTGEGEPFLHPQIFEIVTTAKKSGANIILFTNGTLLDKEKAESLVECRLDTLIVSFWASSPEEYRRNHPGSNINNFDHAVEGLRALKSIKMKYRTQYPQVIFNVPLNIYNFQNLNGILELAMQTGCNGIQFSPMINWGKKLDHCALSKEQQTSLCLELTRLKKQIVAAGLSHNIDRVLLRYQIGEAVWKKIPCYVGWFQSKIKVDGTVVTCPACNLAMGSLNDNTLGEIWEGHPYRSFRRQTMAREGVEELALGPDCDCGFCCHADINLRIHRFFKWFALFRS